MTKTLVYSESGEIIGYRCMSTPEEIAQRNALRKSLSARLEQLHKIRARRNS